MCITYLMASNPQNFQGLWLANCYFACRRACNIVHFVLGLARIELVSLILKALAPDSILARDKDTKTSLPLTSVAPKICANSWVRDGFLMMCTDDYQVDWFEWFVTRPRRLPAPSIVERQRPSPGATGKAIVPRGSRGP